MIHGIFYFFIFRGNMIVDLLCSFLVFFFIGLCYLLLCAKKVHTRFPVEKYADFPDRFYFSFYCEIHELKKDIILA